MLSLCRELKEEAQRTECQTLVLHTSGRKAWDALFVSPNHDHIAKLVNRSTSI